MTKDNKPIRMRAEHLVKEFRLPHERSSSLKQTLLNFRRRGFEEIRVLDDINFEVREGEFFGIVGRNGSGKSTLLKLLAGIYAPTSGTLNVNGDLTPFIELGVGFNPELSGRENVFLNGAILGLTQKEIEAKYQEIVEFAEIERFMDQKLKNYSSGMQVRLAFSIAIQAHNNILLIDEVLAVGDAKFQRKCYNAFREIKKSGKTVVFVTHDMGAVQDFCDRAMMLENSKVVAIGKPREIALRYEMANAMGADQKKTTAASLRPQDPAVHLDAILVNDKKAQVTPIEYGQDFDVTVRFTVNEPTEIQINLFFANDKQEYLAGINTTRFLERYKPAKGTHELHCRINGKQLVVGEYSLNAALYTYCKWPTNEIPQLIDALDSTYSPGELPTIKVVSASEYHSGLFNLDAEWREGK